MTLNPTELTELVTAAQTWADEDPDAATAAELRALLAQLSTPGAAATAAAAELADRFAGELEFGTAGLRAALGAGPRRMNRVVVRRTAAGIASFLQDSAGDKYTPSAVIGYDARHNSRAFALETAAVFSAAGIETFLLPCTLPTPVLAYAVRALDTDAGVMVTASHNPAADNGYKVYLGGRTVKGPGKGAQIVAPYDAEIAARIDYTVPLENIHTAPEGWTDVSESIVADYISAVDRLVARDRYPERDLKIVLTSLHGVGGETMLSVLRDAGFRKVVPVAAQAKPDPDFPTVAFPNPEEPGALDLALETAVEHNADLVIANDPDADRVAVAAKDPANGEWRMLRGDEVGALLGRHLSRRIASGHWKVRGEKTKAGVVYANSIVSSRLLARVADAAGFAHMETLTGFKWISRVPHLTFGYEEALGYCVAPGMVRDKDGISAGLLLAEMAAALKAKGRTLFDELDDLAVQHGLHLTDQLSVRVDNLDLLGEMMARLRATPPEAFGGSAVDTAVDLSLGSEDLPPTDGLKYLTRDNTRVIIRPSGTEPKLKCYLEVIVPVSSAEDLPAARRQGRARLDSVLDDVRAALGL
ncbi:phospho-sugar mutase [Arthrobacter jiangjiafuii]|uniref:Phospho-sugar mutase n=1 Tax=Arthrobacter jiangjiafuii TaxID=2817475 RepID=A0A975R177_9MICC|nr:phospho-sugar mutase [Arthrobacter jiangjiafuii]MBP3043989.1 phospho-sugar mutase [Arthrobacter jiangjiafuii]QWC10982.1 phospho-sugar mutase [Arthrobacter jiangjiafuii]